MPIPPISCDHAAGLVDCPAERADLMMPFFFWQYGLFEPVMKITGNHLYEQEKLIAFIINLAVLAERESGLDPIYGGFNCASLVVVMKDFHS